jgi:hypothetical protein
LRFSVPPTLMDRRILAHQQGCRIPNWPSTTDNPIDKSMVDDPDTASLIAKLLSKASVEGALALRYPDDSELFSHLRNIYDRRLAVAFRRKPTLDLGLCTTICKSVHSARSSGNAHFGLVVPPTTTIAPKWAEF